MKKLIRILIVEDSEDDAELVLGEIRRNGYDTLFSRVDNAEALRLELERERWDVIISDYTMPHFSGLAALQQVRQAEPDLPFIIVSGNIGEDIAVGALHAGANDYVLKNGLSRLVPAIERELREGAMRQAARRVQRALEDNEARLHALVSNVPGVVLQLLHEWHGGLVFSYVSYGCTALLELTQRQLRDDAGLFFDLLLGNNGAELRRQLGHSSRTMEAVNWEGPIKTAESHTEKWISLRLRPRHIDGGRVQWEGIMLNITKSKQDEIEILRSRQQLSELSSHLQQVKELERAKVAREIHDDIGGNLTAVKIDLLWLTKQIRASTDPAELLSKIHALETLVDSTMSIASRIARDLRPPLLELGLLAAVEWEASEFEKRMEIPCIVNCANDDFTLNPELGNTLFSVFREILTNISKHAQATHVEVELGVDHETETVTLQVSDNGSGIKNTDLLKAGSFGLRGMLERAHNLGGEITFSNTAGKGTTITARLPLAKADASKASAALARAASS